MTASAKRRWHGRSEDRTEYEGRTEYLEDATDSLRPRPALA